MAISLELLTDDDILDYSRSDGKDHVLYSHGDLNLKFDRLQPITGGVYDTEIFGSPMVDRCVCGKIRQASPDPQPCTPHRAAVRQRYSHALPEDLPYWTWCNPGKPPSVRIRW